MKILIAVPVLAGGHTPVFPETFHKVVGIGDADLRADVLNGVVGGAKQLDGAVLFLLNNDAAAFITGVCLPIDGAFSSYSGV